jgi:hypothetical protein
MKIASALIAIRDTVRLQVEGKTIGDVLAAAPRDFTLSEENIIRQAWEIASLVREMVKL